VIERDCLFHDMTEFLKDRLLVGAVAAAINEARSAAHITLVFI
jgi:hypothetical protein